MQQWGPESANNCLQVQHLYEHERTRLVSRPTWRNTSFNASISSDPFTCITATVCPETDHWLRKTFILLHRTCHLEQSAYRSHVVRFGTVLKDIFRHSCLIAVTRPSDRYLTSTSVAFCGHIWRSVNVLIIITSSIIIIMKYSRWAPVHEWSECHLETILRHSTP